VRTGATVVDFELPDQQGVPRRLSDLVAGGPVVLFFYPGALTYGCTKESCHFRDLTAEFAALGAQPVGISVDAVSKQKEFSDIHGFAFPLLSDASGAVAALLGVKRSFGPVPVKRTTFVIDQDRTVKAVIHNEISMHAHADKALEVLRWSRPHAGDGDP
jgi:peroxiredoxin Q/BCP